MKTLKFTSRQAAINKLVEIVGAAMTTTDLKLGEFLFDAKGHSGSLMFNHNDKNQKVWNLKIVTI